MTRQSLKRSIPVRYGVALLAVALWAALLRSPGIGPGLVSVSFIAVAIAAWYGGVGPGLFATLLVAALGLFAPTGGVQRISPARATRIGVFISAGIGLTLIFRSLDLARRRAVLLAEESAAQAERLRITLGSIGDAVIVTDARGVVTSLNRVAERLTGWPEREARGRPLEEVFRIADEATLARAPDPADRVLAAGRSVELPEPTILIARDGTRMPIDDSASPIRGPDAKVVGVVLVFRDISARRATERRLAEAEARFRAFMDRSPVLAYMKDERGRYLWGNAAWGRLHEGGLDAAIGRDDAQLWPAETAARFRVNDLKALAADGPIEVDEPVFGPDGRATQYLSMKFRLARDDAPPLLGGVSLDVTQRIESERLIRESEARYRRLFESNPQAMWVFDLETFRFLAVNDAAVQRYGYSREEFLAMDVTTIRPPEEAARLRRHIATLKSASEVGENLWTHRKKDGTPIDVEIASHEIPFEGRPARLVLAIDVTARRQAEAALRLSRDRLDLVINAAELGLWYCDIPVQRFTINPRAHAHFGYAPGDPATFDSFFERIHPDDLGPTREAIARALEARSLYDAEYRIRPRDPDGGPDAPARWIRAIGRAFADESGEVTRFDGISIDIDETKRSEARLREATEAALEANRVKDTFLAVLGHELRTPLTPVLAALSTLLDDPDDDGPPWSPATIRETLAMIRRNVELETRLIGDLLDVSKVARGQLRLELEPVDLHEAIRQAVEICRDEVLVTGLDVRLDLRADDHDIKADPARVLQVAWNLIHNSAKFSPPESRLTIRSTNLPGRVVVEFADEGAGIDPLVLPKIFEPFEQGSAEARRRIGGLGLGLAISRSIVEAHGGTLTATSPGRGLGATFRLDLPTSPRPAEPPAPGPSAVPEAAAGPSPTLLLLEDNPDTLRYLALLLRHRGYAVETASRVEEAYDRVSSTRVDLMISDIELPDGSGLDLMRRLRGSVVGIAVSGFGSEGDVQQSLAAGFSLHLTKPVDFTRLQTAIREALALAPGPAA